MPEVGSHLHVTGVSAPRIFDGTHWHDDAVLLIEQGRVQTIVSATKAPTDVQIHAHTSGLIAPGFIDLQVNGGGDALLTATPDVQTIRQICATHSALGSTSLLPTLISSSTETLEMALAAGMEAHKANVPGFAGLHLEGPHLAVEKAGAHDATHLRSMQTEDLQRLITAREHLPNLLVTLAPEAATPAQVSALVEAGIVVSLGHSNATYEEAMAMFAAGATMATHLFNAMSGLSARAPGLVAATLQSGAVHAGLIADGHHVHPASIRIALAAKAGPGRIFLVSDAMPTIGSDAEQFILDGKTVYRKDGRLNFANGNLAGADLTMAQAVRYIHQEVGVTIEEALSMATAYPANAMGLNAGRLIEGYPADFLWLDPSLNIKIVWQNGINA